MAAAHLAERPSQCDKPDCHASSSVQQRAVRPRELPLIAEARHGTARHGQDAVGLGALQAQPHSPSPAGGGRGGSPRLMHLGSKILANHDFYQ